ncbi:GNAT family N-acetyltransferase [Streptomyces sp. AV19]|uniref:GNAT family N-acetyltransferase n=1 Tax=Streptomyces sp. AV19 TaxID=2793068 RepID=UPI0018FE6F0E|nr:GNAT family N-acetyltransferase [Streptomyces sp. AV19]MBH1937919.1 GNAT family N-acetyltransferase [Streptomyces sp. AV19]MDG4536556.1 GNAT family N-acetyltransferase [Streptomyces sp. AV19]
MITRPRTLAHGVVLRPVALADAAALACAYAANRDHLRPWEPRRPDGFETTEGQAARLTGLLELRDAGRAMPWVLDAGDEGIAGIVNLNNVVRGAFHSAQLGYWVAAARAGRGLGTAAVEAACDLAGEELGLHRIEAGTVTTNAASRRVLEKCGFERIGTAPRYLHIDGAWRDHYLFQRILNDRAPR